MIGAEKELAIKHAESITMINNLIRIIPEKLRTKELYDKGNCYIEKKEARYGQSIGNCTKRIYKD